MPCYEILTQEINLIRNYEQRQGMSNAILRTLKEVAESTLPKVQKRHTAQTWKQDEEFNELLNERMNCQTGTTKNYKKELRKALNIYEISDFKKRRTK